MTVSETEYEEQATRDPIFEIRDTTVKFGMERGESRVLNDVSIDVERNEILGVVGESGSGKSMFASAMLDAVVEPGTVDGEITYRPKEGDPVDVLNLSESKLKRFRWEEVSMVFQGAMSSFNPVRSIETHFVETLSSHDHDVGEGMDRARELLRDLYLEPDRVMESYPHELSGGMQQRVLIALSLLLEPEVIVMDEPTAALDLLMQRSIISLINDLKEKYDLTIVFITHDLPLVADLADRLAVLYAFEFVELGPADEILRHAAHPYTRSLLRATPNLTMPLSEMKPIEGSSPDPVNIPTGCSYHPRCPLSDEQCTETYPHAYDVDAEHEVHCHYWEESEEAIPVELSGSTTPSATDYASGRAGRQSADPVVSMEDVEVHFENNEGMFDQFFSDPETVRAVDGVTLDVYENDVVVLVGESGCGKTTLGKTAIGLQRPTGGSVKYRGQDVWETKEGTTDGEISYDEVRRALQIIHQDPGSALNSMRRLRATLQEPLKRWHKDKNADDRIDLILAMLEYVGMTPPEAYIDRYPHQLSGGEQQRVALIRALLMNPDLILADEPVSALDVSLRVETMDLLMELQDRFATSYLFVSHDLSNARYIAGMTGGRIAVMYLGTVVEMGTVEQIIDDPRHPYTQSLRWATPELNLSRAAASGTEEAPMRRIDVPDPANPPRGCRYHTRCPKVIPPEEYDFDQEEWNPVMDLKVEIEREGFDRDAIDERVFDGDADSRPDEAVAAAVRDHFGIPETLSDPAADEVLSTGIGHLVAGERDQARELFDTEFSTVCERKDPAETLDGNQTDRPVACFLEVPEESVEETAD